MKRTDLSAPFLLFVAFFFLPFTVVMAQKISFETVKVKYVRLPLQPLPAEVKSYYSKVVVPQKQEDPKYQHYRVSVEGLKYVNSPGSAGLIVELNFREFGMLEPKEVSDEVYRVNTAQKEQGYYYELQYDFPAELVVTTADHRVLLHREMHPDSSARFKQFGKWTFSEGELEAKYREEAGELNQKVFDACLQSVLKQAKELVNSEFAFTPLTYRQKIAVLKSKKAPFYKDFQKAAQLTEVAFDVDRYEPGGDADRTLQQALDIWQRIADADKANGVTKMLALYNCAAVSRWMNRFDEAGACARRAAEGITPQTQKKMTALVMPLPEEIRTRKERYKANGLE